jgi:uncharacterized protein YbjT (DUF2867 family)
MSKTALITGGTGLVGTHLINCLIDSAEYDEIKVLVRKGSKYHMDLVTIIEVDYDHLSNFNKLLNADIVFCCLGTTMKKAGSKEQFYKVDFSYPLDLAKIVKANGCEHFNIITASGANAKSMFFYNRVKGEVESALGQLNFKNLNIFRPSLLLGERNEQRAGEQIGAVLAKIINPFLIGRLKKIRAIQAKVVARAMRKISMENHHGIRIISSDIIQANGQD